MNNIAELLKPHSSNINIPGAKNKVYKDECVYSFDTPVIFIFFYFFLYIINNFLISKLHYFKKILL